MFFTRINQIHGPLMIGLLAVLVITSFGCAAYYKSGGGTRTDYVDDKGVTAVYGHSGLESQLGYVIYTNVVRDETYSKVSSNWRGEITPEKDKKITFYKITNGMNINEQNYDFKQGRVFVVKPAQGQGSEFSVTQLDIAFGPERYDVVLDRLEENSEIQQLLRN